MDFYVSDVKSGDPENVEGRAAAYYWDNLFRGSIFLRHRFGEPPNNLLNYGYAILRAIVARSLIASGLFPSIGIHHRNKYNPYCLADDIMEPFRPYVDSLVLDIIMEIQDMEELTPEIKKKLLQIPVLDVVIDGKSSPLMVGVQRTTASLASCFEGETRKILYPEMT
jgi:CRISPR-associated protein Cas1